MILEPAIATWRDAVLILGENEPRTVHRAELVIEFDADGKWRYALTWWPDPADEYANHYTRTIHRLLHFDVNGMRGRHDNCDGDIGVFTLNRRGVHDSPPLNSSTAD